MSTTTTPCGTGGRQCVCGHRETIHRLNRDIGDRSECWAMVAVEGRGRWCQCRQFLDEPPRDDDGGVR